MQTFLMYVVVIVLMTPLLLFYGLPFIAVARLVHTCSALWLRERTRFVLACGIASLGIAPAFDDFLMPKSIYLVWLSGGSVPLFAALVSFAITWVVVMLQLHTLTRHHGRQYA
jgi:hypothetical protein